MSAAILKNCVMCSKQFKTWPCRVRIGHGDHCSSVCVKKHRLLAVKARERACMVCGDVFSPRPRQLLHGRGKYCSHACLGKAFTGAGSPSFGRTHTPEEMQKRRDSLIRNGTYPIGPQNPCWKGGKQKTTQGYVMHNDWQNKRRILEHRFVAEQIRGQRLPPGVHVHHKDEDRKNNSPDNLEVLSVGAHLSLHTRGSKNAAHKIVEADAKFIRHSSLPNSQLAEMFGMTTTNVWYIKSKRTWKHVT